MIVAKNLDYFLYVDADIIYKNPINLIKSDIKRLEKSGHVIAARTEV